MIDTRAESAIEAGKETIEQAIHGLESLKGSLDDNFVAAVHLVYGLKGRLIVSGMGKSGHIGRKIAATLASTGTPAYFVHPAEASHGDLGMITKDDAVLLLSNSGETKELEDIIEYCKRFSIPMIGLVRRAGSMLVEAADVALVLPEIAETSITGAPTTSTTMMLVYGDAIAMALLELRGFTKEDFRVFHPGGKLGKGLLRVVDLMHAGDSLPLVSPEDVMKDVLVEITAKSFGCAAVVDEVGQLVGVITDGDLRRHLDSDGILQQRAKDVMSCNPVTIRSTALAAEALAIMNERKITSLFVVEDRTVVGVLHIHDCLRAGV